MCGIAGAISGHKLPVTRADVQAMTDRLRHRGPDSFGVWEKDGAVLGHRRLAVVDLSDAGHQPMLSQDGRMAVSYNGEIYNHLDIRKELEKTHRIKWCGYSDTETLVEALSHWGVEKTLPQLNGMFAFACWDISQRTLLLARDPFGEKPLYYSWQKGTFIFASELSAIRAVPAFNASPDLAMVSRYLQTWYVPGGRSILQGVNKLPPGHKLEWREGSELIVTAFWSLKNEAEKARLNPVRDDKEAIAELDDLLQDAVKIRMMSDVPLGALLSGGVDSSLIAAIMQKTSNTPIRTFTIGFEDKEFDEAPQAAAVAKHLGTQHETLLLTEKQALAAVPLMGQVYDEPFADSSQVPTYLVSSLARKHVTVALSGDGCDELFSGYARYTMAAKAWNKISKIPMRRQLSTLMGKSPDYLLDAMAFALKPVVPSGINGNSLRRKLRFSGELLRSKSLEDLYNRYMNSWHNPAQLMAHGDEPWHNQNHITSNFDDPVSRFMYRDSVDYLPDDILVKVDRASMAVSLETRIPALDKRVAAFAWRLPPDMRWRDGRGKWALRQVLCKYVPKEFVERPKKGFSVPLDNWLRGPLRAWMHDLLDPALLKRQGVLNADVVTMQLQVFENFGPVTASQMWTLLMFQSWMLAGE